MASFLFEIGLEEIPARMIVGAEEELKKRVEGLLVRERLVGPEPLVVGYSTPRRLAVKAWDLYERQEDVAEEVMGPAVKIAFKDGVPGPAAMAFAKKSGVDVAELKVVETPKGEYVAATSVKAGKSAAEVIAEGMPKELAGIYWAKNMYWRAGKPERFVRPVRWMVALLGDEAVPVEFGGHTAGRETYGHRVLYGAEAIRVSSPETYAEQLKAAFVMADVEARRHTIRKALDRVCRTVPEARWREDHALVDKMTHMTEWPTAIAGAFEAEYLALPEEVLVTVMRDHQNYFAVEGSDGKLMPHFLAVLNTVADEAGEAVIRHGNERVLRARFNDARFFWEFDQRVSLEERVGLLEHVTFQKDLGSYAEKSERVAKIALLLADRVTHEGLTVDRAALSEAARLAKVDLTTELVKEFTELQGRIGGLYASRQGIAPEIAEILYWQYEPSAPGDPIPPTVAAQILGLADRINTVVDLIAVGHMPSGSRDPFALRRAANGIIRILAEGDVPLSLNFLHETAESQSKFAEASSTAIACGAFLLERLEFYLRDTRRNSYDVVKAVLAVGTDDVRDAVARAEAVTAVRGSEDFAAVSAAFKRMKNILAQNLDRGPQAMTFTEPKEFHPAQEELSKAADAISLQVDRLRQAKDYEKALTEIAKLRPSVDAFFDQVMVVDPDEQVRASRLRLLASIVQRFGGIAEFSEIVVAG